MQNHAKKILKIVAFSIFFLLIVFFVLFNYAYYSILFLIKYCIFIRHINISSQTRKSLND